MTIAFAIMAVGTFAIALFPKMSVPVFVALCAWCMWYVLQLRHRVLPDG